jgi:hypothetical protein
VVKSSLRISDPSTNSVRRPNRETNRELTAKQTEAARPHTPHFRPHTPADGSLSRLCTPRPAVSQPRYLLASWTLRRSLMLGHLSACSHDTCSECAPSKVLGRGWAMCSTSKLKLSIPMSQSMLASLRELVQQTRLTPCGPSQAS